MVTAGLIDEVRRLVDEGLGEALKTKKIVGYTEILNALEGDYSMDEAINLIKQHTRNYAKRQMTWFRNRLSPDWINYAKRQMTWFRNRLSPDWINPLETGFHDKVFELIDDYLKRT
jgi:tRNA dimethylallyltransferase